ncbi:hypothetical protein [Bifidobacterium jacchi]|uniref:Uncharacterized protein n=1 Tax=Bifidobacterium jacchi TaxID=2490545 RepID=A0A5N5RIS7_9BIFI|nr:hypothetical protein [Bifidobacterium jacchi]KAB5607185.1 hypothetical protein EHS19_05440 [Bifidobacterium jacchi]
MWRCGWIGADSGYGECFRGASGVSGTPGTADLTGAAGAAGDADTPADAGRVKVPSSCVASDAVDGTIPGMPGAAGLGAETAGVGGMAVIGMGVACDIGGIAAGGCGMVVCG